jgi:beta-xylosidase
MNQRAAILRILALTLVCFSSVCVQSQATADTKNPISKVWVADNGDGTYKNPVLHADYSDPDVVRVGDDFFMTASSFNAAPGLPILQSKDLVNWKLIGHALPRQPPFDVYSKPQHGNGVWAPSIRFHDGNFYIYYSDPDYGIYLVKASSENGPWSEPILIKQAKGWIDPCPLWDANGNAYLVNAMAASRSGIKSILVVSRMSSDGTKLLDDGAMVFDGHDKHPTVEGPKFYQRNGYYYIFAPAGGVEEGWQLVLRSKNVYGPYEGKIVLAQGTTQINGPHQGAWIETPAGENWFMHFQDKGSYGRVVHLQPLRWINDWPVIGADPDGDGTGEPVLTHAKPKVMRVGPSLRIITPPDSDEFDGNGLGLQCNGRRIPRQTRPTGRSPRAVWVFSDSSTCLCQKGLVTFGTCRICSCKNFRRRNFPRPPNSLSRRAPTTKRRASS